MLKKDFAAKNRKHGQMDGDLTEKLRRRANDNIKPNRIYGHPGYNISGIQRDIAEIRSKSLTPLSDDEEKAKKELLKAEALPDVKFTMKFTPRFAALRDRCRDLVSKKVSPSKPIQELLNDALLQSWVKSGITHHREKRETCGFCGQPLPSDLWNKLDAHFNEE